MSAGVAFERPALEVAEVIRQYGDAFVARHGDWLSAGQRQALRDLARCRTAALGGHVQRCLDCGHERIAYNSCRNRHCPKCQALSRARWLQQEAGLLLPVEYFHVVFTLPAPLSALALANPRVLYELLLESAAATLREVAANPKHLGAQLGVLMVLHTWGQNLHHHPHVHCVCTGGGLSCNERGQVGASPRWMSCRPGFFLPVRVLSRLFRGKYLALLQQKVAGGELRWPDRLAALADSKALTAWLTSLYAQDWVVYAKRPFGGPEQVLKYLARYTHRVAISNSRLLDLEDGQVTFRYKDYADAQRHKTMTLSADEFLRRFVQHVLPKGFMKVRHYGLLANRCRAAKLHRCRRLLWPARVVTPGQSTAAATGMPTDVAAAPERCCAQCGSQRLAFLAVPKGTVPSARGDTS